MLRCAFVLLGVWLSTVAVAEPLSRAPDAPPALPQALQDWVPWVLDGHTDLGCPVAGEARVCVWPGPLALVVQGDAASFSVPVTVDGPAVLPLPGGAGSWPTEVTVDGRAVPVHDAAGVPQVALEAGRHAVAGRLVWATRPNRLPLPGRYGVVDLSLDGTDVLMPRIEGGGLTLGVVAQDAREGERLDLEVTRKVTDGVPLLVETVVQLRVSGRAREVDLGNVLVPGTVPVMLNANVPARFTEAGTLLVQVRPGGWSLGFTARHVGPGMALGAPQAASPWPATEYWAVATADTVRAIDIQGPPAIDAARAPTPERWKALPTYAMDGSVPLTFEELRRGDPDPAPNQLTLRRELWLDLDGQGFTVRDVLEGQMRQGWRLDLAQGAQVGRILVDHKPQVITQGPDGAPGVEVRGGQVVLEADYRLEGDPGSLSATGWRTDVQDLQATLHLPPGWTLLTGSGIDSLEGSVLARWTLFDLFFVLVLAMATLRLFDVRWGLAMLATLVLTVHVPGAPQWLWVLLLVVEALHRVVADDARGAGLLQLVRVGVLTVFAAVTVSFAQAQMVAGFFPQIEDKQAGSEAVFDLLASERPYAKAAMDGDRWSSDAGVGRLAEMEDKMVSQAMVADGPSKQMSLRYAVDPSATVQTGPGVPKWSWTDRALGWSGPVGAAQQMGLVLLGPRIHLILSWLRVGLVLALALRLTGLRPGAAGVRRAVTSAALLLATVVHLPVAQAQALPTAEQLAALQAQLTQGPPCAPQCVTVPTMILSGSDGALTVQAEVHAEVAGAWPLPGPTTTWVPARITVDGAPTTAVARLEDGHLYVRLPRGVHTVVASGAMPAGDAVGLAFGLVPKRLIWQGDGWSLDGLKADGTVGDSVQLARMLGTSSLAQSAENLAPWLTVERSLHLGVTWEVTTKVVRHGPTDRPLAVVVPLLAGESVLDGTVEPVDGAVAVTLGRDQEELLWRSTLAETASIELVAPEGVPWTERWSLLCSPIFACTPSGPAPIQHVTAGVWSPQWLVWPGERVTIDVQRPAGVAGQTLTIESAELAVTPGRRQLAAVLSLDIRASQGSRRSLTLPEGAVLSSVEVDGRAVPLQLSSGGTLDLSVQPGSRTTVVRWQQDVPMGVRFVVPEVDLGGPAANVTVVVHAPQERWVPAVFGPDWGPVPLLWSGVLLGLILAFVLGRVPLSPLSTTQWALLGLGMNQVPAVVPVIVAGWFLAMAWRAAHPGEHGLLFNVTQLSLVFLTMMAAGCLYAAIHTGLLGQPDMQIVGNGSWAQELRWYVDHTDAALPQPSVLSFPVWTFRVGMLLWSLWLAWSLVRWVPWAWKAWTTGGWVRPLRAPKAPPPAA